MKNLKLKRTSLLVVLLLSSFALSAANDFKIIYERMYYEYLSNPSETSVEDILNKMQPDGSFYGINYKTTEGTPRNHPIWLTTLAAAYKNSSNKYYRNSMLKEKFLLGLQFWVKTNHNPANWWFRYIAYPKETTKAVVLMSDEIKMDKELFDKTVKYLRWSYETAESAHMTGANACDIIMGSIAASIITENTEQMIDYKNQMTKLLVIQQNEGIEADFMYGQHSGNGRQLYLGNYGKEYINSALYYFEFCNNTQFNSPGIALLEDFYIKGIQWIFYSKNYDPNQAGRYDTSDKYYGQFESMTKRLLKLNTERKVEIKKVYDRITGENSLSGNRMFWRFDYMINRRSNYMVSTRMSSTRTVGSEAGNGDGEYNFYSGNGTNYIFITGKEYNQDYFKLFNNRQFPGITAEQDDAKLPIPNWGEKGGNGNSFAGGVSDSTYGACGMILDRRGLTAHKSWFYFDDEFVCLGAGINQTDGKSSVYTTINQCNVSGSTQYSVAGKVGNLKAPKTLNNPDWVLQGKIGYFNLDPKSNIIISADTSLFSANIDHGTNPINGNYAYIVNPALKSASDATKYKRNIPISVESNTDKVQAVSHKNLNIIEVMFFEEGTLKLADGKIITVDQPCALLWKEKTGEITLANPKCETQNPPVINVKITQDGKLTELIFQMPNGVNSGSSVTKKM
ncbi:MAG: polysaccharide lyase family 8 super-sandwich domain-containing protein [Bacteroidales bacterium]|nr:polysaccharide lyase family 8 super-sandwich domain-containing protein [Bacteroidales bacterium]